MKKVLLIAAVVAFATSCKKDYTCTCTATTAGISASSSTTAKMKKKEAEDWCEKYNTSSTVGGVTSSTSCKLS